MVYDLVIIGGGISGLSAALCAARRGYSTCLLEAEKLHASTSNNSLRILHGGFRYLQSLHIPRVLESIRASELVRSEFPDFVRPLRCLLPLQAFGLRSRFPVSVAASVYSLLARSRGVSGRTPKVLSQSEVASIVPAMAQSCRFGGLEWQDDIILSPQLLAEAVTMRARDSGALIRESARVVQVKAGPECIVHLTSGEEVRGRVVVNAAGSGIDSVEFSCERPVVDVVQPEWCIGVNVVFAGQPEQVACAGYSETGRFFFLVPRSEHEVALGTMYLPVQTSVSLDSPAIQDFIQQAQSVFPQYTVDWDAVRLIESGSLPCRWRSGYPQLFGRSILRSAGNYHELLSTKYTTFLSEGERIALLVSAA